MPRRHLHVLLLVLLGLLAVQGICGTAVAAPVDRASMHAHAAHGGEGPSHCCASRHTMRLPGMLASAVCELDDESTAATAAALALWPQAPAAAPRAALLFPDAPQQPQLPVFEATRRLRL